MYSTKSSGQIDLFDHYLYSILRNSSKKFHRYFPVRNKPRDGNLSTMTEVNTFSLTKNLKISSIINDRFTNLNFLDIVSRDVICQYLPKLIRSYDLQGYGQSYLHFANYADELRYYSYFDTYVFLPQIQRWKRTINDIPCGWCLNIFRFARSLVYHIHPDSLFLEKSLKCTCLSRVTFDVFDD